MALGLHHKVGMVVLSVAAPRRLARIMLRPYPQPMAEQLQCAGQVERIEFAAAGGLRCRGWWVIPPGEARDQVVVLAHGWTSHALRMSGFVDPLLAMGFQVMLYNARSHGDSDMFPVVSLAQFTEDLTAAVAFARQRAGSVVMLGHSLGAAATLVAAADGAPIDAAIVLAPPGHPADASADILRSQGVPAGLIMRRIGSHVERYIGRTFESIAPELRLGEVRCPVLLIHGTEDEVVPVAHFHRLAKVAGPNVRTCLVEGVNHDQVKSAPQTLAEVRQFLQETAKA
jgi:alpha-beta hydrolase superfamily lysophospholipase